MKLATIFIVFIFLSAFASHVSAQEQTPKIIWENILDVYENSKKVKPAIRIKSAKPIFVVKAFHMAILLRRNEFSEDWHNLTPPICGYASARLVPTKLYPNKEIQVDFVRNFNDFTPSPFMPSLEPLPKIVQKGKYKLRIYYGLTKSGINLVSESPEFEVVEYRNE